MTHTRNCAKQENINENVNKIRVQLKCKSETFPPPFYFWNTTVRAYLLCDSFWRFRFDLFFCLLYMCISCNSCVHMYTFLWNIQFFVCINVRMYVHDASFSFIWNIIVCIARATAAGVGSTEFWLSAFNRIRSFDLITSNYLFVCFY